MLDPMRRWSQYGEKPDYAGLLTFGGVPYTEDPDELAGVDVAIVGAPMDDLTSDAPGARFGPRAIRSASCPPGPHLEAKIDAIGEALRVVDFGDAPVIPADPVRAHAAIRATVAQVLAAGAIPIILGGDHSIAEPDMRACAERFGPVGLVHFDTHTDTGEEVFGAKLSHGTPMYKLVEDGIVDAARYAQIGLRGYWPGEKELGWQRDRGIRSWFMHDVRDLGIRVVIEQVVDALSTPGGGVRGNPGGPGPEPAALAPVGPVFLSIDVDVLDPAYAPGTGTPEPGGMTSADLLWAAREIARRLPLVGADIVEVSPTNVGSRDITALVAERTVREILTGIALRRRDG